MKPRKEFASVLQVFSKMREVQHDIPYNAHQCCQMENGMWVGVQCKRVVTMIHMRNFTALCALSQHCKGPADIDLGYNASCVNM